MNMFHYARQLVHLATVIDSGSISVAANKLGLTQSAVSQSIRVLEQKIGGKLLNRGKDGTTPTRLGDKIYVYSKNILTSLERVDAEISSWSIADKGSLFLGSTSGPSAHLIPDALLVYLDSRPNVRIGFDVKPLNEMLMMLQQGTLDVFVAAQTNEALPHGVVSTHLAQADLSIICRAQHPLCELSNPTVEDLSAYPWMTASPGSELRTRTETIFENMGLLRPNIVVETLATSTLLPLLIERDYLTMHSKLLLAQEIKVGTLVVLTETTPSALRPLTIYHREAEEQSQLTKDFINFLLTHIGNNST